MSCRSVEPPPPGDPAAARECADESRERDDAARSADATARSAGLGEAVRAIVVTRERTPRDPRWAAAWRRTLFRYVDELERLKRERKEDGE